MSRTPRRLAVVPYHPHHVILRGNNRRRLFSYATDYRFFLLRLLQSSQRYGVAVHSAVQMTNHIHLIVTPPAQEPLSKCIGSAAQVYAQFRNRKMRSTGKLFEERFKCIPIDAEERMAVTTAYVALNPVHAGLCRDASDHRWSTFRRHAGLGPGESLIERLWTPSSWFLSLGATPARRSSAFVDLFEHYRARDDWSDVCDVPSIPDDSRRMEQPGRRRAS